MSDDIQVRVTHVPDGDGIDGVAASGGTVRIRLHGIDAPELGQRNSLNSRNYLRYLVRMRCHRRVRVERMGIDRYGRIIGAVYPAQETVNATDFAVSLNELMVEAGLAYSIDEEYDDAEAEAQGRWGRRMEGIAQGRISSLELPGLATERRCPEPATAPGSMASE